MKKLYFEPVFTCVLNLSLLIIGIVCAMEKENVLILSYIFIFVVFITEFYLYIKKSRENKYKYSIVFFVTTVFFAFVLYIFSVYYLNNICLLEYQESAKIYFRFFPYIYLYPAFIYPSGISSIIYCKSSKTLKCFLVVIFLLLTILLPQFLYR